MQQQAETADPAAHLRWALPDRRFGCILADPPWQFVYRTGKVAPEHRRLSRYGTLRQPEIRRLPVAEVAAAVSHLHLWMPNARLPDGPDVMKAWRFTNESNIIRHKLRKNGGSDDRGVGFYFGNLTEILLFGTRGTQARTLAPGRQQVNCVGPRKREHSRHPDEQYPIIEACSPGPRLEIFACGPRQGATVRGNEAEDDRPSWITYAHPLAAEQNRRRSAPAGAD